VLSWRSKQARVTAQIRDMCAILSGLVVASDYKKGQQLVADRDFKDNAEFFRDCFEVGRRHKVRRGSFESSFVRSKKNVSLFSLSPSFLSLFSLFTLPLSSPQPTKQRIRS